MKKPKKRKPIHEKSISDRNSNYITTGFNQSYGLWQKYHNGILKILSDKYILEQIILKGLDEYDKCEQIGRDIAVYHIAKAISAFSKQLKEKK